MSLLKQSFLFQLFFNRRIIRCAEKVVILGVVYGSDRPWVAMVTLSRDL